MFSMPAKKVFAGISSVTIRTSHENPKARMHSKPKPGRQRRVACERLWFNRKGACEIARVEFLGVERTMVIIER
jgi:hypothetical protein